MKIIDENGEEIIAPDLSLGRLVEDKIVIAHHDAIEAVAEQWHYATAATYSKTGGRDVVKVIDVPGVAAQDAWDEYEDVLRYIPYTAKELAEMEANRKPTLEDQIAELREALELLLSGVTE